MSEALKEYRSIYARMLDGKRYQALPSACRFALLCLKLKLGAAGIRSLPGAAGALADWTGLSYDQMQGALEELEKAGWIEREGPVIWLVQGLEFEPGLSCNNPNHRVAIHRHILNIRTGPLVERFVQKYPQWCKDLAMPSRMPSEVPSEKGSRITKRLRDQETGDQETGKGDRSREIVPHLTLEGVEAYQRLRRASRNPVVLDGEILMIMQGGRRIEPTPTWEGVSLALHDLVLNGKPVEARSIRTYVADAMRQLTQGTKSKEGPTAKAGGHQPAPMKRR